ncbi:MAG: LysR family transcriptional regulator [Deltaproteobacteria bacterium]|nr:LysR family transcriptional regulator [Deltaproteobacteria bacterium]
MDIPWEDAQLFLAVAETGSVSRAARAVGIGQPTVSRRLALLEYRLGAKLFLRSPSGATLTTAGERLVEPARKMAEWAGELSRAAASTDRAPRGLVRVTAPPWICFDLLAPFAAWMLKKSPGLRLQVLSTVSYLDLARGEAELALRPRAPAQPELTEVGRFEHENAIYVARSVAARLPKRPKFTDLPWIAWAPPYTALPPNPQLEEAIPGFVPMFSSDNFLVNFAAARAGVGAVVLPKLRHRHSPPHGLVPLKIDLGPFARGTAYLVCAKSALDIPRVRQVAQLLMAELSAVER